VDSQVTVITSTGIPKLVSYPFDLNATSDGQTKFEIPYDYFNSDTDTLMVFAGGVWRAKTEYTITNPVDVNNVITRGYITFKEGRALNSYVGMLILKNVALGPEGTVNGNMLAIESIPQNRVVGLVDLATDVASRNTYPIKNVVDLNNETTASHFSFNSATVANSPTTSACYCDVIVWNNNDPSTMFIEQKLREIAYGKEYKRVKNANGWTNWTVNIADNSFFNATCIFASSTYTLTLLNAPSILPGMYTIRFQAPNNYTSGTTFNIGTKTYTLVNASFVSGEIVTINVDEVNAKCFFKSGGVLDTLPNQVSSFTGTSSQGSIISLSWVLSDTTALDKFLIVYNTTAYPQNVNDGTRLFVDAASRSTTITGSDPNNDVMYYFRIFPLNSKGQAQTAYKVVSVLTLSGYSINNLGIGAKIKITTQQGTDLPLILIDRNHAGNPNNTLTFITENIITSLALDSTGYLYTTVATSYLGGYGYPSATFYNSILPAWIKALIQVTTLTCATSWEASNSFQAYCYLLSAYEIYGGAPQGTVLEGTQYSYFSSTSIRKSNYMYWTRTPQINNAGTTGLYWAFDTSGNPYTVGRENALGIRPVFNITQGNTVRVTASTDSQGYYHIVSTS
jgi:hypothetical protein